jgi:CRISPR system Cascade subunit CasA
VTVAFNLVDEPWIPALRNGSELVSLRTALLDSHNIRALALEFSSQAPALMRQILLPVVLHSGLVPRSYEQWGDWFSAGRFSSVQVTMIEDYLTAHHGLFDLFDAQRPFGQAPGLTALTGEIKPVAALIAHVANGNNVPLFTSYSDADDLALSPGQAALWMLHAQCWDTAAIKTGAVGDPQAKANKTTGNKTGPLGGLGVVVPTGESLYGTLLLNLRVLEDGLDPRDAPQWMGVQGPGWNAQGVAKGLCERLTWQARRIRLIPDQSAAGTVVNRVMITAGDRFAAPEPSPDDEPHTLWRRGPDEKGKPAAIKPRRHAVGRAAWRGLDSLIALDLPSSGEGPMTSGMLRQLRDLRAMQCIPRGYPVNVEIHGFKYGTQSAVFEDVLFDRLPLPVLALSSDSVVRHAVLELAAQAGALERALNRLADDLRRAAGGDPMPWDKGQRPGPQLLHALAPRANRLLAELRTAEDDDAVEAWMLPWEQDARRQALTAAEPLLAQQPASTFLGRKDEKSGHVFRAATAERAYRMALNTILTRAAAARPVNIEER